MTNLVRYVEQKFAAVERERSDLHDYQRAAVEFLKANPFSALFIDMGLGKSVISLTTIIDLLAADISDGPVLVIAPVRVANETWPTEIGLWRHTAPLTWKHVRGEDIVARVNAAGRAARVEFMANLADEALRVGMSVKALAATRTVALKDFADKARRVAARRYLLADLYDTPAAVHIINREQVEFLVTALGRSWPWQTVFIDESSSLKDHKTARFKALAKVRPLMKRMHQLTATPAAETFMHLFAQIYLLDLGERFGKSHTKFAETYFTQNRYTMKWTLRPGAEEQITDLISDICLVMKQEDYLDLQQPIPAVHDVLLPPDVLALYEQLERDFVVELPSGVEIEAETAAALSQKLLQLASGVLYETRLVPDHNVEDSVMLRKERVVHHLHDCKIDRLRELAAESNGNTLLVAYHFASTLDRLKAAFPQAVQMDAAGKCIPKWNKGQIPMMLVHPQSGGHGLNLQKGGHHIVFFDIPWSLELYLQFIGRLARQGQTKTVVVHHLVAKGTVDAEVVDALSNKRDAQEVLFRLLKRARRRHARECAIIH